MPWALPGRGEPCGARMPRPDKRLKQTGPVAFPPFGAAKTPYPECPLTPKLVTVGLLLLVQWSPVLAFSRVVLFA